MSVIMSDAARQLLSQSLPLVEAHKAALIDHMQARLEPSEEKQPSGHAGIEAAILVEMLIGQVRQLLQTRAFEEPDRIRVDHEARGIAGRTYSRFGDALVPILKDVLGPNLPSQVPGLWCDAFWTIVREATSTQPVLETV